MKLTAAILLVTCMQVSAKGWSQITIVASDVPLTKVFAEIQKQSGYDLLYAYEILQGKGNVSIDIRNATLQQALDICLRDKQLTYTISDRTVIISEKNTPPINTTTSSSPPGDIHGRVTNDHGEPLVNANVIIKRTGTGTITNSNGEFNLKNIRASDELLVSFVGYEKQIIKVGDKSNFILVLKVTTNDLDKVVVQAYGTTSQRLATGNIGTVTAEQIAKQPVMNVLQAIQGQVPGVVVTNTSGYASGTVKIEIRGRSTLSLDYPSDPLYIIDGVPLTITDLTASSGYNQGSQGAIQSGISSPADGQSPFFNINPKDIESIEILKDADATAIYGSRGANGVILVTTKKGKPGKTLLDLNVSTGFSQAPRYYSMLNTPQYVGMRKEALLNDGVPIDINSAPDLTVWDTTRYTNWQKYLWGIGKITNGDLSVSGGNDRTTFRLSGGFRHQVDILSSSGANQRGSLSFNLGHKSLNQRLNFQFSGSYTLTSIATIYSPGVTTLPPNAPAIFDDKNKLNFSAWSPLNYMFAFGSLLQPYNAKTNLLSSNLQVSYSLTPKLVFRTSLGYNNVQGSQSQTMPIASQDPVNNPTGSASEGYTLVHNTIVEPQLEYNNLLSKGKLNVLIGATKQNNATRGAQLTGLGYNNDLLLASISKAPIQSASNLSGAYKYAAIFGRINYNWENKYIVNFNMRRDGSSKFGPGKQYGNFGSGAIAWIFTEENFIKSNIHFLSFGKVRASYGSTGGDQIPPYSFFSQWEYNRFPYNGILPVTPIGHVDSTLQWQVNYKTEIAISMGFLDDRINIEAAWYRNRCNNQLVPFPTPSLTGFTSVISNSPANVENKGWEFTINSKWINNKKLKWTTIFQFGINKNKLLSYPNLSQSPFSNQYIVGKSLNIVRVLHYTGIDPQTGLYVFDDKNKDGQINIDYSGKTTDDRYAIDLSTRFDGGISNTISYKSFDLSLFFYFRKQTGRNVVATVGTAPGGISNQPSEVMNRWQKPGDASSIGKFTTMPDVSFYNYQGTSDAGYTDASFVRLQNLMLSYYLPEINIRRSKIAGMRLYVQGQNLFVVTKYKGIDPETQSFGGIPLPRIITGGLNLNF